MLAFDSYEFVMLNCFGWICLILSEMKVFAIKIAFLFGAPAGTSIRWREVSHSCRLFSGILPLHISAHNKSNNLHSSGLAGWLNHGATSAIA
jgi:hypothetical protein